MKMVRDDWSNSELTFSGLENRPILCRDGRAVQGRKFSLLQSTSEMELCPYNNLALTLNKPQDRSREAVAPGGKKTRGDLVSSGGAAGSEREVRRGSIGDQPSSRGNVTLKWLPFPGVLSTS